MSYIYVYTVHLILQLVSSRRNRTAAIPYQREDFIICWIFYLFSFFFAMKGSMPCIRYDSEEDLLIRVHFIGCSTSVKVKEKVYCVRSSRTSLP